MDKNILVDKTLSFSVKIIKAYKKLNKNKEFILSKQLLRSATSIGANVNEALYGVSKADFISKLQISLKETSETEYWLRLLLLSEYINAEEGDELLSDCIEIKKILVATLNTSKSNMNN